MRALVITLSIGYGILGLIGVLSDVVLGLSWLNLIVGGIGTLAALSVSPHRPRHEGVVAAVEGLCAGVLWVVAMALGHRGWMTWWTLVAAVVLLLAAVGTVGARAAVQTPA